MTPTSVTERRRALMVIIALPIIWGTTFSVVQHSFADITPVAFALIRFGLASALFLGASSAARRGLRTLFVPRSAGERSFRRDMLILGLAFGGGYILQNLGLLSTTTSKSAFLTSTTIIWTPLLSRLLGREHLRARVLLSILITVSGVVLMTAPWKASGIVVGDALTLGCAMMFAIYIIWTDRAMLDAKAIAGSEHEATMMVTSTQIIVALLLFVVTMPFIEQPHVAFTRFSVAALIYTALVATILTAYLQTRFQHHVSPTVAAIIYMLEPVVAMIIAELFLTERMGFLELLGGGLIILGVVVAQGTSLGEPGAATVGATAPPERLHPEPHR